MKRSFLVLLASMLLAGLIWLVPVPAFRFWASFGLLWLLPGLAWMPFLTQSQSFSKTEKVVVAQGLNFIITPLIILLLAYLPGKITKEYLIIIILVVTGIPLIIWLLIGNRSNQNSKTDGKNNAIITSPHPFWKATWFWLLVILILAALTRLLNLGYSEFQGDEAAVLVKAARILTGEDAVLFQHKKGPLELLLTMGGWRLTGITNEWMSRLPFAWASLLGIASILLYGRRQSSLATAVMAGGFLAVEGYLVGFGRIVQYQSVVFLLSSLALFCLLIYVQQGKGFLVFLAATFFALGTWAHYDAILFLPAGLLLIVLRLKTDWQQWRRQLPVLTGAGILGLFLAALFYLPFLRSSQAEGTLFYVSGRIGSDQAFYNHLLSTMNRGFVYDSVYFLSLLMGALSIQILFTWRRWGKGATLLAIMLVLAVISTLFYPDWWLFGENTYAWVPMALLLVGSLIAPGQNPGTRALWLWLGVPAMFYLYFVALPLTHVYTAIPGAVLLAATGLFQLGQWVDKQNRFSVRPAAAIGILLFVLSLSYTLVMFVSHEPEYLREYPKSKMSIYWTPYGEELPHEGLFGFPYRVGWKTIGYLMDSGQISGSYDSNEERDVTDYYMRRAMRFDCATPDYYVVTTNVQDEVAVRFDQIESDFSPSTVVTVNGWPKTTLFQQDFGGAVRTFAAEDFETLYDLGTTPEEVSEASPAMSGGLPAGFVPMDAQISDFATLRGYQINTNHARPGGYVELLLLWQAIGPAAIDYQVFTHLHDGQEMRGQLDGQPLCNSAPSSQWVAGTFIVDPYRIPINPEAATGLVPLTVGMYDLATLQRLPVTMGSDNQALDAIFVTDVEIRGNE